MTWFMVAVEKIKHEPVGIHIVYVPEASRGGFYRQVTSLDAFRRVMEHREARSGDKRRFRLRFEDDHEFDLEFSDRTYGEDKNPLRLAKKYEHASVWEFYEAIGYDKTKKRLAEW